LDFRGFKNVMLLGYCHSLFRLKLGFSTGFAQRTDVTIFWQKQPLAPLRIPEVTRGNCQRHALAWPLRLPGSLEGKGFTRTLCEVELGLLRLQDGFLLNGEVLEDEFFDVSEEVTQIVNARLEYVNPDVRENGATE
jgi:hypothetical protein